MTITTILIIIIINIIIITIIFIFINIIVTIVATITIRSRRPLFPTLGVGLLENKVSYHSSPAETTSRDCL